MVFDPVPAAKALRQVRLDRGIVVRLPDGIRPETDAEGAAVQRALADSQGVVQPAGFKIGATGKRMQDYLGIATPIAGFMQARDIHRGHAELRFAGFIRPAVECEVAVRLAHDLPPGPCSLEQALAAVDEFFAAAEIVENRYADDLTDIGTPTILADQMYHCAAVIGDGHGIDWRGQDIGALRGRICTDTGIADEGIATDLLGHPLNGLAWLAGSAEAAAFGGLKAGQVVMLGSVTPPLWLTAPATVTVSFPPFPAVTVRFA
jgi:2-keto-4-pentenoate hydratase